MKKVLIFLSALVMVVCVACVKNEDDNNASVSDKSSKDVTDSESQSEYDTQTGDYVKGRIIKGNSSVLIVLDNNGPVTVNYSQSDKKEEIQKTIDDLDNGDLVEIKCGLIAESYPGQTTLYNIKFIEKGTLSDIDKDTLSMLKEMGWIE